MARAGEREAVVQLDEQLVVQVPAQGPGDALEPPPVGPSEDDARDLAAERERRVARFPGTPGGPATIPQAGVSDRFRAVTVFRCGGLATLPDAFRERRGALVVAARAWARRR